jgi:cyanate lyase
MNRQILTEKIVALKQAKGISWKALADGMGLSSGFATAALLDRCR